MNYLKRWSVFLMIIGLAACGFHLRGNVSLPLELAPIYIDSQLPTSNNFADTLAAQLTSLNIKQSDSSKTANTILHLKNLASSEDLISVSASTNMRQYNLKQTLTFELTDTKGKTIIPVSTVSASNPLTVDSSQVLSTSSQKQTLTGEMNQALVQQLLMRLASHNTREALGEK